MAKIAEIIRLHRERFGWSQERLATQARLSPGLIREIEGDTGKPSGASVWACVRALGYDSPEAAAAAAGKIHRPLTRGDPDHGVPVVNQAPAGDVTDYHECSIDSGVGFTYIGRGDLEGEELFAVVITGDSMVPRLLAGDYVVFMPVRLDSAADLDDGDVVFVRLGPRFNDGCTVAYYRLLPDRTIRLEKHNPRYPSITCGPEDIVQIAVAVQRREKMKDMKALAQRRLARGSDADMSG